MYDTIKFVIKESELDNAICFLEEIPCRISIKSTSSNRVVGFLKNMKIEVRNTTLIVQGSLLKYFKGYNYAECLSVWDVRKSINKLSNELNVPMRQAVINRIDIGICFSMVNVPWVYWDCLLHSDGYFRSNIKQETLYFDKYDSQLCFYDKKIYIENVEELLPVKDFLDSLSLIPGEKAFIENKDVPAFCQELLPVIQKFFKC